MVIQVLVFQATQGGQTLVDSADGQVNLVILGGQALVDSADGQVNLVIRVSAV